MAASDRCLARRIEAERLISMAKGMLTEPEEEIASIYLDHAMDALQAIPAHISARSDGRSNPSQRR